MARDRSTHEHPRARLSWDKQLVRDVPILNSLARWIAYKPIAPDLFVAPDARGEQRTILRGNLDCDFAIPDATDVRMWRDLRARPVEKWRMSLRGMSPLQRGVLLLSLLSSCLLLQVCSFGYETIKRRTLGGPISTLMLMAGVLALLVSIAVAFVGMHYRWRSYTKRPPCVACEVLLAHAHCPSCGYFIGDLPKEGDGATVCSECGGAWRVGEENRSGGEA